jgi:hypothetical protein
LTAQPTRRRFVITAGYWRAPQPIAVFLSLNDTEPDNKRVVGHHEAWMKR